MTEEQRAQFKAMADALDEQLNHVAGTGYELQQAFIRLAEAAMWIRRALDRAND